MIGMKDVAFIPKATSFASSALTKVATVLRAVAIVE
jgi:hypothetical protein